MSFVTKPPTGFIQRQRDWFFEEAQKILRQKQELKYMKKVDCVKKFGIEKKEVMKDYETTLDYFFGKIQQLDHEIELLKENVNLRKRPIGSREITVEKNPTFQDPNTQPRKILRKLPNGNFEEVDFPATPPDLTPDDWKLIEKEESQKGEEKNKN
jgi:hypothetical protein